MRKNHTYEVTLKNAITGEKRIVQIKETSMINAILAMNEIENMYEYILKLEMKS